MVNAEGRVTTPGHRRPAGERGMVTARYGNKGGIKVRHDTPGRGLATGTASGNRARVCGSKPLQGVATTDL
jgi:hypothetical protein